MKELVETVVKGLVDAPDQVRVEEEDHGREIRLKVYIAEGDRGHVIGRNGSTVNALRTLCTGLAQRQRQRIEIDIVD